jgi:transposase
MLQPLMRRTWAKRGKTPVLKAWDRHDRLTCLTALTVSPKRTRVGQYFRIQRGNAKAADFFWFILELKRQLKRPLVIIWDRLAAHRKAQAYFCRLGCDWVQFEYLPAYSPELNPVEHVWSTTKWGRLANWPAPNIDDLNARLTSELTKQKSEYNLLRSHFASANLGLD